MAQTGQTATGAPIGAPTGTRAGATAGDGTVGKALEVLDSVASYGRPVRFSELLADTPYPKATLYRFLQTLTNQRMLTFDPERSTYAPGIRLVRLAHAAWAQSSLAPIARTHLDRLSALVGETVHLAQFDHAQVLYVDKRNARQPVEMFSQAGKIGPAYCTGVGKVMLAHLPPEDLDRALAQQSWHRFTEHTFCDADSLRRELDAIRARGYGFDNEEHEPGIICVAVPILTAKRRLLGALSVTSTTTRTDISQLGLLAPQLQTTARAIADEAETWAFPQSETTPQGGA
ncbi:IclR family transcriptional regulator [Puniceibacterium sediminis]|uniref:Transcriptional regulator, IclR family n=1 Tax=Puniceibacterium sediminis TaxID=1608407 RepID=A0A238UZ79_9RHOB|nr:IclR family transcriptional regulator [Puniceibacterium sediminis]SNR27530.1 transcriptional regulator, IclR family [Puniceibacterium sediminis]